VAPNHGNDTPTLSSFADPDTTAESDTTTGDDTPTVDDETVDADPPSFVAPADRPRAETVELGVELLAAAAEESLPLPEAVDRIETVTREPTLVREVLDTAETRGVIERDGASVRSRVGGRTIELDRRILRRDGAYDCRRCGQSLSTGHFLRFETGEVGPFGSSCIRKVTGRA
jgi:hypothetical protein